MNRMLSCGLVVLGSVITLSGHAEPIKMSIQDALKSCLSSNLEIKGTQYGLQTAEAKKQIARSLSMPKLDVKPSMTWLPTPPELNLGTQVLNLSPFASVFPQLPQLAKMTAVPVTIPSYPLAQEYSTRATLDLSLPLYTSGRIEYAKDAADMGYKAVIEANKGKVSDVVYGTALAYYQAQLAQSVADAHQTALSTVQKHLDNAESLYKAGVIAKYDVLRAQTELAAQQKRLTDATNTRDLAVSALLNRLNMPLNTEVNLSTLLSERDWKPTLDATQADAVNNSRELKALKLQSSALTSMSKVAAAADKPQLALIGKQELITNDLTMLEPETTVILGMQWNFFDGGQAKAEAKQQKAQADDVANTAARYTEGLKLLVQQAYSQLDSAKKGLISANQGVETAEEALRLATKRFEVGAGTSVEQLDAILAVQSAQVQKQQALYQMDAAYLALKKLTDTLIDDNQNFSIEE